MVSAFALAIFSGKIVLLYEWKMTAVIFHSLFHKSGSRRQTAASHRTADSFSEDRPLGWDPVARRAIGRAMEWPDSCPKRKLSAVLRLPFLLSDLLQVLHAVLEAVEEGIHILRGVFGAKGHPDGGIDGKRVAPHGCQRVAGLTAPASAC